MRHQNGCAPGRMVRLLSLLYVFFIPFVPSNQPSFSSFPSTIFVPVFLCFPSLPSIPSFLPWCLHLFQVLLCTFNLDVPPLTSHDSSHFAKTCQNYHVMDNAKDKPRGGTHSNSWSPQDVSIGWWPISMKHRVSPWPFPSPSSEFQTNLTSTILISSNKGLSYSWCWIILDLTDVFFDFPGSSRSQTSCWKNHFPDIIFMEIYGIEGSVSFLVMKNL